MIVCSCVAYVCLFCYRVCVCLLGVVVVFAYGGVVLVWLLWFVFGLVVWYGGGVGFKGKELICGVLLSP
jgi:hypothetical protein